MRPELAIVIPAYNRPNELDRLLRSVQIARDFCSVKCHVIVSIDGNNQDVIDTARGFESDGIEVRVQGKRLGLREHILKCGDISQEYNAIIVLEDDLILSPSAFSFVDNILDKVKKQKQVASLSLYSFHFNEYGRHDTFKSELYGDLFYAKTASSWGQVWWKDKWSEFRNWLSSEFSEEKYYRISEVQKGWPNSSWKKLFNMFMSDRGYYSAAPRYSYCLNAGSDTGTHVSGRMGIWFSQVIVTHGDVRFVPLNKAMCLDEFLELETYQYKHVKLDCGVSLCEVEFDLAGIKKKKDLAQPFILTRRPQNNSGKIAEYDTELGNPLFAIVTGVRGKGLSLVRAENYDDNQTPKRSIIEYRLNFPWLSSLELLSLGLRASIAGLRKKNGIAKQ